MKPRGRSAYIMPPMPPMPPMSGMAGDGFVCGESFPILARKTLGPPRPFAYDCAESGRLSTHDRDIAKYFRDRVG